MANSPPSKPWVDTLLKMMTGITTALLLAVIYWGFSLDRRMQALEINYTASTKQTDAIVLKLDAITVQLADIREAQVKQEDAPPPPWFVAQFERLGTDLSKRLDELSTRLDHLQELFDENKRRNGS